MCCRHARMSEHSHTLLSSSFCLLSSRVAVLFVSVAVVAPVPSLSRLCCPRRLSVRRCCCSQSRVVAVPASSVAVAAFVLARLPVLWWCLRLVSLSLSPPPGCCCAFFAAAVVLFPPLPSPRLLSLVLLPPSSLSSSSSSSSVSVKNIDSRIKELFQPQPVPSLPCPPPRIITPVVVCLALRVAGSRTAGGC